MTISSGASITGGWLDNTDQTAPQNLTTILEWEVSVTPTTMVACITGFPIGTPPEFTIELYNTADPGLILSSQTYNFSNTLVIDTDMTISQAVGLGLLLDPVISGSTKQDVQIDAVLTADINYNFGAPVGLQSGLKMSPDSRIIVQDQVELGIGRTLLSTCDEKKWDGILIEGGGTVNAFSGSEINNAVTGVELLDNASLNFGQLRFDNCITGIGSFGTNQKNINIAYFASPFFFGTLINCETGIRLENCNTLNLQNYLGFFYCNTGISLVNTSLNATDTGFNYIGDNSIEAEGSMNVILNFVSVYESGGYGVELTDVLNTTINESGFLFCSSGIVIQENLAPTNFDIQNSRLWYNFYADISADILPGSVGIVFSNDFGLTYDNSALYNVILRGIGMGTENHQWSINDNDNMYAKRVNVFFNAINRGSIFKNDQVTSGPPFSGLLSRATNFLVRGGERNYINNNDNLVAASSNINMSGSQMSQVSCNDNISAANSMRYFNDNSGTEIYGNSMNGQGLNYVYGSLFNTFAVTDIQENHLNLFNTSTAQSPKARHYGPSAAEVNLSQHLIHTWNVNQGDEEYPFFTAASEDWFTGGANAITPFCPLGLIFDDKVKFLEKAVKTGTEIFINNIALEYNESTHFESALKLYRNLSELEELQGLNEEQSEIMSAFSNHIAADYVVLEKNFDQLINVMREYSSGVLIDIDQINSVYQSISDLEMVENTANNFSPNVAQLAEFNSSQDEISGFERNIIERRAELNNYKNNYLENLLEQVESLPNSELPAASNRKNIYPIIFDVMQSGKDNLNEEQMEILKSIATQCLGIGGEPVLWARNLLATNSEEDDLPELIDECLVKDQPTFRTEAPILSMSIMPNPTSGKVNIEFSGASEEITVEISDQLGHRLLSKIVSAGTTNFSLDLSHLPEGMYFISSDSYLIPGSKIIVTK